jgi:hypothetical protein
VTFTVPGRPEAIASRNKPQLGGVVFPDGKGLPVLPQKEVTVAEASRLVAQARADLQVACTGTSAPLAIKNMLAALPTLPAGKVAGLEKPVAPLRESPHAERVGKEHPMIDLLNPVAPVEGADDQNNFIEWNTHDCQSCTSSCATNPFTFWIPPAEDLCIAGCFIPGVGGCDENFCSADVGFGSCDRGETCCGSICCGPGSTCGDAKLGICCPNSAPVGCGDQTEQQCFAPGATCCGPWPEACPSGSVCGGPYLTPSCCAPQNLAADGTCCSTATCGGACCPGACVNGACCFGPVVNGVCCPGGVNASVCNGACCDGKCTTSGACCDTQAGSTLCGSACCSSGEVCVDAATSTCAVPSTPTFTVTGEGTSGGPTIVIYDGQSFSVTGLAWSPGTVTLSADSRTGTVLGTATASGTAGHANFSMPNLVMQLPVGNHTLVAWETVGSTVLQATLPASVQVIH